MANIYLFICQILWGILGAYWLANWFGQKKVLKTVADYSKFIIAAGMLAGILFEKWAPVSSTPYGPLLLNGLGILGVLITISGIGIAIWARMILAGNWSATVVLKKGHELVKTGPYAYVRHPIYSGMLLATLGSALAAGSILFGLAVCIAAVGILAGFVYKLNEEEKLMREQFPKEYPDYMRQTKRLIPYLY